MRTRKTVAIAELVETANAMLRHSTDDMDRERSGIAALLESVLLDAHAYKGFRYLTPIGQPGYDETRRAYYVPAVTS